MPLFQFYAPLPFLIIAGFYGLLGKFISLFLLFRFFIFGTLLVFPVCFYWFIREYLGPRAASFGIWLSFAWIFYPKLLAATGIGASGAIFYGLFSQVFAVCLTLVFLVALRKILVEEHVKKIWYLFTAVLLASIILSHTLSAIQVGFTGILIGIYYRKHLFSVRKFLTVLGTFILGVAMSAFWFMPFLLNLTYTSGEKIGAAVFKNPLVLFFPFDPIQLLRGEFINFAYGWLFIGMLAILGFILLVREKKYILPYLLGASFIAFHTDYIIQFYNGPIHYYRFFPLEFAIFLAIAGYGLLWVWDILARRRMVQVCTIGIFSVSIVGLIVTFNLGGGSVPSNNTQRLSKFVYDIPYYWSLDRFEEMGNAQRIIRFLSPGNPDLPEPPVRILSAFNPQFSTEKLSSIHFFDTAIPLANKENVLFGLYAESAWQLPFIFPTTDYFLGDNLRWGRVTPLSENQYFQSQSPESMVERLRLFGINYIVTASERASESVSKIEGSRKLFTSGPFNIFWIGTSRPYVYSPAFRPGIYIDADGSSPFRDFALGWYSMEKLLKHPIAALPGLPSGIPSIDEVKNFDFVVMGTSKLNDEQIAFARVLGKPVVFLDLNADSIPTGVSSSTVLINNFHPIAGYYGGAFLEQPNVDGLERLENFIMEYGQKNNSTDTGSTSIWSDNLISAFGNGPLVVNASYFPYWTRLDGTSVYPVTPGQMLTFGDGKFGMQYHADGAEIMWRWISGITALGVLVWVGFKYLNHRLRNISHVER